jgi:FkbM family methyltransferase
MTPTIRSLVDSTFPWLASTYRLIRDQRKAARWRKAMTPLGIEMVGVARMGESRDGSGELTLLSNLLDDRKVFVDVGANCGFFTLAARKAGATCIAIEPNADNLRALFVNLRDNQFRDVEVFPVALSGSPDLLPLFGGGEGASLEKNWGGMRNTYSRIVPCNTLDNIVAGRFPNQRMLIKVDVEGHELEVLRGATSLIDRTPAPAWLLEHGFRENFEGRINPNFRELFELFWQSGYQCVTADAARRPVTAEDVDRWLGQGERDFGFLNYLMFKP